MKMQDRRVPGNSPRQLKDPRSSEYALQTIMVLKRLLETENAERKSIEKELALIRQYRHWEVLGYDDERALLLGEFGDEKSRVLMELNAIEAGIIKPVSIVERSTSESSQMGMKPRLSIAQVSGNELITAQLT
jgi:hypothetical protein